MTQSAGREAGAEQVIVPFGFEVLHDRRYLSRPLKRFNIYCSARDPEASCTLLIEALLAALRQGAPAFYATIGIVWAPGGPLHRSRARIACRQISVWPIPLEGRSLELRWADYLLATPNAVVNGCLRESARVQEDHHALRYLLQLCVIQEALLGDRAGRLNCADRKALLACIRALERNEPSAVDSGRDLFEGLSRPYAEKLASYLARSGAPVEEREALDFHGAEPLQLLASPADRDRVRKRVVNAYRRFGKPEQALDD